MPKLNVLENKKLKLINVLQKELKNIDPEDINKEIEKFMNKVEVMGIQTKGPLITENVGTVVTEDGLVKIDYNIMIQTVRELTPMADFSFEKEFVVPNCLYLKYTGSAENMHYAQAKIDVYMYENDYINTGQQYIVHMKGSNEMMEIDIFRPIGG